MGTLGPNDVRWGNVTHDRYQARQHRMGRGYEDIDLIQRYLRPLQGNQNIDSERAGATKTSI